LIFDPYSKFQRCQRLLNGILSFLKLSCVCGIGELVAWYLVDKRGVKADPWEGSGFGFNFNWWGLIS
jgi:hypothetical protein